MAAFNPLLSYSINKWMKIILLLTSRECFTVVMSISVISNILAMKWIGLYINVSALTEEIKSSKLNFSKKTRLNLALVNNSSL